jgi:AcrR family transcriptional regulator
MVRTKSDASEPAIPKAQPSRPTMSKPKGNAPNDGETVDGDSRHAAAKVAGAEGAAAKSAGSRGTTPSARERLLAAANELFYAEGVHTVGIDRVIERAGVAKASLYSTFGSKEELVRAYLKGRAEARRTRITDRIALHSSAREKITAIFDLLGEIASEPAFRGCAFVNATAEGPRDENRLMQVCSDSRAWMRNLFTDLARECGAKDAARLGRQLALVYDGAITASSMERGPEPAREARSMAEMLLDAHVMTRTRKSRA